MASKGYPREVWVIKVRLQATTGTIVIMAICKLWIFPDLRKSASSLLRISAVRCKEQVRQAVKIIRAINLRDDYLSKKLLSLLINFLGFF